MNNVQSDIQVINSDGTVSIRESLIIVFYIRKPNLEIVQNIELSIRKFVDLVSINALPEYFNYDGDQEDLTEESLNELIYERLIGPNRAPNGNIEIIGRGVHAPDYYLWYNGKSLEVPGMDDEVSFLWCWVPRSFFLTNFSQVIDYISNVALELPFTFAYASLGLVGENKYKKQGLANRFPGLDIAHPGCVSADLGNKAAGSYWLTLLGPELYNLVGGAVALRAELPEEISIEELTDSKCRILLNAQPEIGDTNRRDLLPMNKVLASFFHDKGLLHIPNRVIYFVDKYGMADRVAMERWHQRFLD